MGDPPTQLGATQFTVTVPGDDEVAITLVGAPPGPMGVMVSAADGTDVPITLVAVTVKVWASPGRSELITHQVCDPDTVHP